MPETTAELTEQYIKDHPAIRSCLKKGLINYSSLARHIAKELKIEKKTSLEAALIAARRYKEKLQVEEDHEQKIQKLLSKSELVVRNKTILMATRKEISSEKIDKVYDLILQDRGTFYFVESESCTLITQEKYFESIQKIWSQEMVREKKDLTLLTLVSLPDIAHIVGVVAYITTRLAEGGINLVEIFSSWKETHIVVESKDATKTMALLKF